MKGNVGGIDRIVRILGGIGLLILGFVAGLSEPWNYVAMGVGAVFLATGLMKFCLLYTILGINSCPMKK
ncbi:MAG: DUF2892 domain-containing protein [Zetaproteobacteria bacterium]|nr:DUF2892 domain-containing protein [Zetaproteobacteria bacterium]MDQ6952422.1 DUF2892 domain-containing protein [Mariprofundaceae bacterium]